MSIYQRTEGSLIGVFNVPENQNFVGRMHVMVDCSLGTRAIRLGPPMFELQD